MAKDSKVSSEVYLNFTTQLYHFLVGIFFFALFSDEPEAFLPKYFQMVILNAAHFRRVVKQVSSPLEIGSGRSNSGSKKSWFRSSNVNVHIPHRYQTRRVPV